MEVYRGQDPVPRVVAINRWAQATWQAYADLHPLARKWIAEAMDHPRTAAGVKR